MAPDLPLESKQHVHDAEGWLIMPGIATSMLQSSQGLWARASSYLTSTLRKPFQRIDPTQLHQQSLEDFEQARRQAILRCLSLSFSLAGFIIFLIILFFRPHIWLTPTRNVAALTVCIGTLCLSYTRIADFAGFILLGGLFCWLLFFIATDPTGLSIRTVALLSLVPLLILGSRFLLPVFQARVVVFSMSLLALIEARFLPTRGPYPTSLVYIHQWILGYLVFVYGFTILLSWIAMKTTRDALETYAIAYAHEYAMEQQQFQFLQIASHELRAPLTPLLLSSHLLQRYVQRQDLDRSKIQRSAQEMDRHVRRMDGMIDLLLDMNRVEQQRFLLEYETIDIAQIIRDVVETQQPKSRRSIVMSGCDAPVVIEGDPRRLWQVFSNIIVNSMKYTPEDTLVEVNLNVLQSSKDHRAWVQIIVRDEGPGIASANLPHLFDRYYRIEGNSQGRNEGWGLGLFLCYEIVTAHGGTISVSSEPEKGTKFIITLPRSKAEQLSV